MQRKRKGSQAHNNRNIIQKTNTVKTIIPSHIKTNERSSRGLAVSGSVVIPTAQCRPLKAFASR